MTKWSPGHQQFFYGALDPPGRGDFLVSSFHPDCPLGGRHSDVVEGSWNLCALPARQAHRKDRALARLARHGHVAAHHARELAGDGEAEPGAAESLSGRGIGLAELLEQLCLLLRRHADAGGRSQLARQPDCASSGLTQPPPP